ncbi:MAG: hypothetical protein AAF358_09460 [Pseudomonadota bacterium]
MARRIILGPQRPVTNLGTAAGNLPEAPVAVVSAAWKEAEGYIDDLAELVPRELVDLHLNRRAEAAFAADHRLRAAHQERQERLKDLQRLYQLRMRQLMTAARQVMRDGGAPDLIERARSQAVAQIQELDRQHVAQARRIHQEFVAELTDIESAALAEQVAEVERQLSRCEALLITGGNVAVLANRLRLFGDAPWLHDRPVLAWSAGAMALTDSIVLFNDHTPQGRREPEVLMAGASVLPGLVFFPGASRRLKLDDQRQLALLARRFAPARCVTLDSGASLVFDDTHLTAASGARLIGPDGDLTPLRAA